LIILNTKEGNRLLSELILDKKRLLRGMAISIFIGFVAVLIVFFITTNAETWDSLTSLNNNYLLLAVAVMLFAGLIDALRIKFTVEAVEEKISVLEAAKVYYISNFAGGITPFFSGTLPTQIYLFNKRLRHNMPLGKATMVATIIPVLKTLVFSIFAPIIFFSFKNTITSYNTFSNILLYSAVLFSVLIFVLFVSAVKSPQKVISLIHKLQQSPRLSHFFNKKKVLHLSNKIIVEIDEFQQSFILLKRNWIKILMATFFTMIFWGSFFTIAPLILWSIGINFNLAHVLILQIIFYFILPYLPTPGGSGAAEVGFASLFSFFVPHYLLGLFVTAWRFIFFYFNLVIGFIILLIEMNNIQGKNK